MIAASATLPVQRFQNVTLVLSKDASDVLLSFGESFPVSNVQRHERLRKYGRHLVVVVVPLVLALSITLRADALNDELDLGEPIFRYLRGGRLFGLGCHGSFEFQGCESEHSSVLERLRRIVEEICGEAVSEDT